MSVFMTTYEVNEAGLPIVEAHRAEIGAFLKRCWGIVEEVGAEGFQPGWSGIRCLIFKGSRPDDAPQGWRYMERDPGGADLIRCAPRRNSTAGKVLAKKLASVGKIATGEDVAALFDWSPPQMAMDGNRVFFPTQQTVDLPAPRHFLRLPRFEGDKWQGHAGLTAIPESEFMRAIESHNACVREQESVAA